MKLILFYNLEGLDYYGYIPEVFHAKKEQFESFELDEDDIDLLDKDFVDAVNETCDALTGPGDIDYLNAKQCALMREWLEQRLKEPIHPRLETIYRKLIKFASKAIELNTGIVFDL